MGNIVTKLQAGSKSAMEKKACDAIIESPLQFAPTTDSTVLTTTRTNYQMTEDSNEVQVQIARPTTMPKKKFGFTKSGRKARLRWKAQQRKQIALGIYHEDKISTVVDAARKEAKRNFRDETKVRKALKRESEKIKAQCKIQTIVITNTSSDGDSGCRTGDGTQLPPQMGDIRSLEDECGLRYGHGYGD